MSLTSFLKPAIAFVVLAAPHLSLAVVGGYFDNHANFPFLLKLPRCSGVKVGPRHILTAGHCVDFKPREGVYASKTIEAKLVADGAQSKSETLEITDIFIHPKYFELARTPELHKEIQGPDVAVIEIRPTPGFESLPVLPIYEEDFARDQGDEIFVEFDRALVAGWGEQLDSQVDEAFAEQVRVLHERSPELKDVLKTFVSRVEWMTSDHFTLHDIDEFGNPVRASLGDSGGPALVSHPDGAGALLVGIVAFQEIGGGKMRYTKTPSFSDWLGAVLAGEFAPQPLIEKED